MARTNTRRRDGTILPFLALTIVALLGMIALGIDVGLMAVARTEAQDIADLAALAGARQYNGDTSNGGNLNNWSGATAAASTQANNNKIFKDPADPARGVAPTSFTSTKGTYAYDAASQRFVPTFSSSPGTEAWSVLRANVSFTMPTYFGRVLGVNSYTASATATAAHRPRDIALILDYSGSMRFGSESMFYSGQTQDVRGSLNPDPVYPKFGHYYAMSQRTLYSSATTDTPAGNGAGYNPMRRAGAFIDSGGETHAANNLTYETPGGPPIVRDFLTRDASNALVNAFHNPQSGTYDPNQTPTATPAPDNFQDQSDSPAAYVGDKFPRAGKAATGNSWAATFQQYWFGNTTPLANTHAKNAGISGTPKWEFDATDAAGTKDASGYGASFKGYSMGPGYYGKTFFIWPPDPRYEAGADPTQITPTDPKKDTSGKFMADWRKRFFCYPVSSSNAAPDYTRPMDDNARLFNASGYLQQPSASTYAVNYKAILAWIKAGPRVLPPNLRAGRVLYYAAIPSDIPASGALTLDQLYWKKYIDYVLGVSSANSAARTLYGRETAGWGAVKVTAKSSLLSGGNQAAVPPAPYMHYNDNPIRPRAHFWFGPLTMLMFLTEDNGANDNMWPGTVHESQCWQLKAGINAALDDIKKNHPNDWAALIFFSTESGFDSPRVPLGRDYTKMKNALFFPFSKLDSLSDPSAEIRPYNSSWSYTGGGDIPNARGGTCPEMGFKLAYNEFSTANGHKGRRGATKVCILETDGVPNHHCGGSHQAGGPYKSFYAGNIGATTSDGNNSPNATGPAVDVVDQITKPDKGAGLGYSTARSPARVHVVAFGDLFETTSSRKTQALDFLLRIQKAGKTSASSDSSIENYKIITGDAATRIEKLRQGLERIMQSGVQVSLIHDNDPSTPD